MPMVKRLHELDFLKGFFIILMIVFHLEYTAEGYPYITKAVYTFHMPAFLLISGFLAKIDKDIISFYKGIIKIVIPYIFFEVVYILMLSLFGSLFNASNITSDFSIQNLIYSIFLAPKGLYWYLHTLILCTCVYYFISKIGLDSFSTLIITAFILYLISKTTCQIKFYNSLYFLAGAGLGKLEKPFTSLFPRHPLIILPLIFLFSYESNLDRSTLGGIAITFLMISLCLYIYKYLPSRINDLVKFLGRNTLTIVVFSPIFTVCSKSLAPLFIFDSTNIVAIIISTSITLIGCFICARISDKIKFSKLIFRRENLLVS